jgi:transcriptional regulator with XRE-family HTH domain
MTGEPIDRLAAAQALLKLLHEHRGHRLEWVAAQIGVSRSLISQWRGGTRVPSIADLKKLRTLARIDPQAPTRRPLRN